jgi:dUTP pyrophosphatase
MSSSSSSMTTAAKTEWHKNRDAYFESLEKHTIGIKKLEKDAILPTKKHPQDAAWDLFHRESLQSTEFKIPPHTTVFLDTGLGIEMPPDFYAQFLTRSSSAVPPNSRVVLAGVIDSTYQGRCQVLLHNLCDHEVAIDTTKAVSQMVFHRLPKIELVEIQEFNTITTRGEGGFGSTDRIKDQLPQLEPNEEEDEEEETKTPPTQPFKDVEHGAISGRGIGRGGGRRRRSTEPKKGSPPISPLGSQSGRGLVALARKKCELVIKSSPRLSDEEEEEEDKKDVDTEEDDDEEFQPSQSRIKRQKRRMNHPINSIIHQ